MSWKLLGTTFAAVFLAEVGDKTQLAAMALASGSSSKWAVFIGASLALIAATAIAVLAGGVVGRYVPETWIKRGAGALFVMIGLVLLVTASSSGNDSPASDEQVEDQ